MKRIVRLSLFAFISSALACCAISAAARADEPTLPVEVERAFPALRLRHPVIITNAGDGSNRVFICEQEGVVHAIPDDQSVEETTVFLDIESKVAYNPKKNEEGLLGFAFHPNFKENGEFFLYYNLREPALTNVVTRRRVSRDDPSKADPDFEEELLRIKQPFWNHNGGTIEFGKDGMLYIGLGDGGKRDDPFKNAQNLETWLGSILRIDVDHKDDGKNYAIPKDNPFVKNPKAKPEIWAYGFRNIWRFSFDRKTGEMWVADVGQDLWEEINIGVAGGNFGWNLREAMHKFGPDGADPRDDLIEPILEYNHKTVGKSITGGYVYRGDRVPALKGKYLYADYVGGQIWALDYDTEAKKVVNNYLIEDKDKPVITFGEAENGDVYFSTFFGILYRFKQTK